MKIAWFKKGKTKIHIRPITWQGWSVLIVFVLLVVYNFFRISSFSRSTLNVLGDFIPQTLFLTLLYFLTANNLTNDK